MEEMDGIEKEAPPILPGGEGNGGDGQVENVLLE